MTNPAQSVAKAKHLLRFADLPEWQLAQAVGVELKALLFFLASGTTDAETADAIERAFGLKSGDLLGGAALPDHISLTVAARQAGRDTSAARLAALISLYGRGYSIFSRDAGVTPARVREILDGSAPSSLILRRIAAFAKLHESAFLPGAPFPLEKCPWWPDLNRPTAVLPSHKDSAESVILDEIAFIESQIAVLSARRKALEKTLKPPRP